MPRSRRPRATPQTLDLFDGPIPSLPPYKAKGPLPSRPSTRPEKAVSDAYGGGLVAGVDEAGRGPLAGPVVAAAVVFDLNRSRPAGLGDSKVLSCAQRARLEKAIKAKALAYGVGVADNREIDSLNILRATELAVARALEALARDFPGAVPVALVSDALRLPLEARPVVPLVKGDRRSASIAAASILAKEERDRLMDGYHERFPQYGWGTNRGYPTAAHYDALAEHGPCPLHRLSFRGVRPSSGAQPLDLER
ncbi:MAG: ribonuclease HII [Sumerlaeia bacterium]